ncbi:hypothetical protein DFA_12184 [Cavenderia fasciculata]|uniref:Uncharacterized protein n=1 Tax=Cavenderia fasciculata TaxID=261658 RepID=F4QCI4_CACFS|nr:uncharacterized protein DFA_12184 [Cavenderia fasciculata]EGG14412.1 hypothetical protein DFA_12184 [Cavenderia fasciculata]|eukprot:XP_004353821.1 hypothetical protein DFA_12184 [Cavenderia fasciculata]
MMIGGKKQKQRPLRLKDKRGRYIQHGVDRVYIRSKKNDKKLIRKLIREALDDERKQQQQLSKESSPVLAWSNPNEVAMIKSIQDANFRESVLKNQQELDKETKKKIIDLTKDDIQVKQEIPIVKKENDRFDQLEKRLSMLFEAKEEKLKRRQEKDDRSMEILYNQKLTEKRIQELEGKYENTRQIDEQLQSIIDMNNEMKEKNLLELERTIQANQVNQAKQTEQQQKIGGRSKVFMIE